MSSELWEDLQLANSHSTALAYAAGIFTCVLVFALYQTGLCLRSRHRRRQRVKTYTVLDKEDLDEEEEEDYELESSVESSPGSGSQSRSNGRISR